MRRRAGVVRLGSEPVDDDHESAQALEDLRSAVASARRISLMNDGPTSGGYAEKWNWMATAVRAGEDAATRLRNSGAQWLGDRSERVQRAVDELERELSRYKIAAIAHGASP
jgi:hypothetical protein